MGQLRVFAAVSLPNDVRQALAEQTAEWDIPGRRVPPSNWHITLRFLGEIEEVTCDRYKAALDESQLGKPFRIRLSGFGAFPNQRKATVVWAGVGPGADRLFELAEACDSAAEATGVSPEDRPFSPHLTLSRVRPPAPVVSLIEQGELDISWWVGQIVLFESIGGRGGVRYEPLEFFPFSR
ncbi:MAG TPA: RNA 2',3'-cyclic phosphodiesterase [Acidimicrobiia bacterium]